MFISDNLDRGLLGCYEKQRSTTRSLPDLFTIEAPDQVLTDGCRGKMPPPRCLVLIRVGDDRQINRRKLSHSLFCPHGEVCYEL